MQDLENKPNDIQYDSLTLEQNVLHVNDIHNSMFNQVSSELCSGLSLFENNDKLIPTFNLEDIANVKALDNDDIESNDSNDSISIMDVLLDTESDNDIKNMITLINSPDEIRIELYDGMASKYNVNIINCPIEQPIVHVTYYKIDVMDEDDYNKILFKKCNTNTVVYFTIDIKDRLLFINNTISEIITIMRCIRDHNINLLIVTSHNIDFIYNIITESVSNISVLYIPSFISRCTPKMLFSQNSFYKYLRFIIGIDNNILNDKLICIHYDNFIDILHDLVKKFPKMHNICKLNIPDYQLNDEQIKLIKEFYKFPITSSTNTIMKPNNSSECQTSNYNISQKSNIDNDINIMNINVVINPEIIIKDQLNYLCTNYKIYSDFYDPLLFNKIGITHISISNKCHKGIMIAKMYNLQIDDNEINLDKKIHYRSNDTTLFYELYTKKDMIKLTKHRGIKYLLINSKLSDNIISILKKDNINFFVTTEELKNRLNSHNVESEVINMVTMDYDAFMNTKINICRTIIASNCVKDLPEEFEDMFILNIRKIEYNDLPNELSKVYIMITKDNTYNEELEFMNVKRIMLSDLNDNISLFNKEVKIYDYGIMANCMHASSQYLKNKYDNSNQLITTILRYDEFEMIPLCKNIIIRKNSIDDKYIDLSNYFNTTIVYV